MPVSLALGVALLLGNQSGELVYEALGPQAPQQERFVREADRLVWRADDGQVRALFDLRSQRLLDPETHKELVDADLRTRAAELDRAAQGLRQSLAGLSGADLHTARQRLDERFRLSGPWAALEAATAADARHPVPGSFQVQGQVCQRIRLEVQGRPVAQACTVAPSSLPGGPELLALLQAVTAAEDRLRELLRQPWPLRQGLHPLLTAARDGGLPLELRLQTPGEPEQVWRLRRSEP